jgi:thiamine pyrophosphate-dependent acetolactate synthase large subunit-like protein
MSLVRTDRRRISTIRCLQEEGVRIRIWLPGRAILSDPDDEIFKQDKFKHILVRHEQSRRAPARMVF